MALNRRMLLIIATGIMALTFLFFVISNALPNWGTYEAVGKITVGLWIVCTSAFGQSECLSLSCGSTSGYDSQCGKLLAARAFMTLACIVSATSVFLLLICLLRPDKVPAKVHRVNKMLSFCSILPGIIGVATGISFVTDYQYSIGAGAIMGIIALIINLFGGIAAVMIPMEYQ